MANTYTPELKAQVIAEWKAWASQKNLVKQFWVPQTTLRAWVRPYERISAAPKKDPALEPYDLDKMAVELVDGSVRAVTAIFGVTADSTWLKGQNAADLAVLAGVISDKLYRLIGAIRQQDGPDTQPFNNSPLDLHATPAVGTRLD